MTTALLGLRPSIAVRPVLLRLSGQVRRWWIHMLVAYLIGVSGRLALVAFGVLVVLAVGTAVSGGDAAWVDRYAFFLIAVVLVRAIAAWAEMWLVHLVAYGLLSDLRVSAYHAIEPRAPAYTVTRRSGDLLAMVMGDVETIELFFAHTLVPVVLAVTVPTLVVVALATISLWNALVIIPFLLLAVAVPYARGRRRAELGAQLRDDQANLGAHLIDSVQGLRELLAFGRGADRVGETRTLNERVVSGAQVPNARIAASLAAALDPVVVFGLLAVLAVAGELARRGEIGPQLVAVCGALAMGAFVPILEVGNVRRSLNQVTAAARRYFAVIDQPILVPDRATRPISVIAPSVEFRNVSFRYDAAEPNVACDMSWTIEAGETLALVGASGSGKSTCVNLLLRFWDCERGSIRIGGIDVRDMALEQLRACIALVEQDNYVFATSVRDNIRLSKPDASQSEVEDASGRANLHEFVLGLPDGYDTLVGERGVDLSGGQRQRLALARAFLKDAPILVLDEATSNLDTENERAIREAVKRLSAGRTTLVIAHRLSTITSADRVVVIDAGRVVASGTHEQLIAEGGAYARLVGPQLMTGTEQ